MANFAFYKLIPPEPLDVTNFTKPCFFVFSLAFTRMALWAEKIADFSVKRRMGFSCSKLKVLYGIVKFIPVFVVDHFKRFKFSPNVFFNRESVFVNVFIFRNQNKSVSGFCDIGAAFPVWVQMAWIIHSGCIIAWATELCQCQS